MHLDSDEIKQQLARADGINSVTWEAGKYHEESADVLDMIMAQAVSGKRNILYDTTMKTGKHYEAVIKAAREAGYRTEIAYADLPLEKAISRAITRFLKGGRFVDRPTLPVTTAKTSRASNSSGVWLTTRSTGIPMFRMDRMPV